MRSSMTAFASWRDATPKGVRLFTRNGYDFPERFPRSPSGMAGLSVRRASSMARLSWSSAAGFRSSTSPFPPHDHAAVLCAFDLSKSTAKTPPEATSRHRKHAVGRSPGGTRDGIAFNKHYAGDGSAIFKLACTLGCEGIVSKRLGSPYRSGRVNHWLKSRIRARRR